MVAGLPSMRRAGGARSRRRCKTVDEHLSALTQLHCGCLCQCGCTVIATSFTTTGLTISTHTNATGIANW
ncbi:MAG TPA: hypothetical protein DGQ94_04110 [Pseudomonas sp.]|nr:hypothetical protein [Pseudomonas sp.]